MGMMGIELRHEAMGHVTAIAEAANATDVVYGPTYFTWADHQGVLLAHIILMVIAWVLWLPICVMLSVGRSKFAPLTQLVFVVLNAAGFLFGIIYNAATPELYEGNAHKSFGWMLTTLVTVHALLSAISSYSPSTRRDTSRNRIQYEPVLQFQDAEAYRLSHDSGQGTEPSSPRSSVPSQEDSAQDETSTIKYRMHEEDVGSEEPGQGRVLGIAAVDRLFVRIFCLTPANPLLRAIRLFCDVMDRLILILGFIAILTGVAVYGGHFEGHEIFSGVAHFAKGGIFFWYGLLVLGRMMGSFADMGWSWNLKPDASVVGTRKANVPSAEFAESFLIFFYGATNVFLEHLGSADGTWSANDLEHASISVLFVGGGLCGMLIESLSVRELLDAAINSASHSRGFGSSLEPWQPPKTSRFSINPMPAIVIMLLGKIMSGHHQQSMTSTMLHAQWGGLFAVAAVARGVTYILMYLSPPTSYFPSRPPTELVVAFCLISGGLIFMGSNSDFVTGMEMYEIHAMVSFTIVMGLTAFLMAWEIVVLAVKGWAIRRGADA